MMNPSVGLTVLTSSPMMLLTIVVFPALSRPLAPSPSVGVGPQAAQGREWEANSIRILISLSLTRALRRIDSIFALCFE